MDAILDLRIQQLHRSMQEINSDNFSTVSIFNYSVARGFYIGVNFNGSLDDAQLLNLAEKCIENIARLRDHFIAWRREKSLPNLQVDAEFINSNPSVALIHDLWNVQKHAILDRPPRSGFTPRLKNLMKVARIEAGTTPNSSATITFDPRTMELTTSVQGSGRVQHVLTGDIVDENGDRREDFANICESAVTLWEFYLAANEVNSQWLKASS